MHWFDWAAVVVVVALAARGYCRGLILQLSSFVAVGLGLVGGLCLHSAAARLLPDLGHPALRLVAGFAIVFLVLALTVNLLARALKAAVDALFLGPVDRILGAALGALLGAQLLLLAILLVGRYLPGGAAWLEGTRTAGLLRGALERILPLLPGPLHPLDGLRRDGAALVDAVGVCGLTPSARGRGRRRRSSTRTRRGSSTPPRTGGPRVLPRRRRGAGASSWRRCGVSRPQD